MLVLLSPAGVMLKALHIPALSPLAFPLLSGLGGGSHEPGGLQPCWRARGHVPGEGLGAGELLAWAGQELFWLLLQGG